MRHWIECAMCVMWFIFRLVVKYRNRKPYNCTQWQSYFFFQFLSLLFFTFLFLPFVKVFPYFSRFPFISMTIIIIIIKIRYVICKFGRTFMCKYWIVHDIYHVTLTRSIGWSTFFQPYPSPISVVRTPSLVRAPRWMKVWLLFSFLFWLMANDDITIRHTNGWISPNLSCIKKTNKKHLGKWI